MHKPESVLEHEMHILRYKRDHLIPARRPDLLLTKKKLLYLVGFAILADRSEKIDKYLDHA